VLLPQFTALSYIDAIERYRCTWLTAVPPMIAMMLRESERLNRADLSSVEFVRMGSAPVSQALMAALKRALPKAAVTNAYGTTEGGPVVFGPHPQGLRQPELSVGYPHPAVHVRLVDAEGQTGNTALRPQASGVRVQGLPFSIKLEKFHIDFYSTGMPKLFASDVLVRDNETGKTFPATIKVNHPLIYKGIAVYQSSFDDGGSKLKLTGFPMSGTADKAFQIEGTVGSATLLKHGNETWSVEWSGFRPFNVENIAANQDAVTQIRNGKTGTFGFLVGQVMVRRNID